MSSPQNYLTRMAIFLLFVLAAAVMMSGVLRAAFLHNPYLNTLILGVCLFGIVLIFRQVVLLKSEVAWLEAWRKERRLAPGAGNTRPLPPAPRRLASIAALLAERRSRISLSPMALRSLLDGIALRLDESREIARYMTALLIFLGLLGTFWGLLETIGAVADAINGLQVTGGDAVQMFAKLKASIDGPLKGMATAFGASLFGLSGSLVLGFLELQASQAQGRFHIELEEWLAGATHLSSSSLHGEGEQGVSAYVEALLERTADGLDDLTRTLRRSEESREATANASATLVERLAALAETMRAQQTLLARLAEHSIELRGTVNRLSERSPEGDRETLQIHQRNIEANLVRLVEESVRSRTALADELRGEFRLLARTIASTRGQSLPPGEG